MEPDRTRLAEHFAFSSDLLFDELCDAIQEHFGLPLFEYTYENDTEWCVVEQDGLEYNISRPFEDGTLQAWDSSVPAGCDVGFSLAVSNDRPEPSDAEHSAAQLVPRIGQALADLLRVPIHHHRTWLGPGENAIRDRAFYPK